jgi:16S rRNA (guanine1207-N2)-methyltransferase
MSTFSPEAITKYRSNLTIDTQLCGLPFKFETTWGLFSPKAIDEGSKLMLDHIKVADNETILDVGSGYGVLGIVLAKQSASSELLMVDKDFVAVEYSKLNAKLNGLSNVQCQLSNGFKQIDPKRKFSLIVSNLPAKVGNELLSLYIQDAFNHLEPGGRFIVVNIGGIRQFIKRGFNEIFGNYKKIKQGKIYTVSQAVKN